MNTSHVPKLVKGLGGVDAARRAIEWFRESCARAGLPGLHLQFVMWNEQFTNLSGVDGGKAVPASAFGNRSFNSCTHYQYVHFTEICLPAGHPPGLHARKCRARLPVGEGLRGQTSESVPADCRQQLE